MLSAHLPALQVVLPLVAAPVCVLLRSPARAWALASLASWGSLLVAWLLLAQVRDGGEVRYFLGGWAAPWGIEYRVDAVNAWVLLIVAGVSSLVLPFARLSVEREVPRERIYLFYAAWLLCLSGLLGIAITGDAFNAFVFLEISSLSTYILVSLNRDRRALPAAFQYLVVGTVGATFMLIGVGLLYAVTGTLNMADLAARLPAVGESRTVVTAAAFLVVGVGLKAAVYPLHLWLPGAYTHAPSAVSAFIAGTATKVSVYLLLRFLFSVFGLGWEVSALAAAALLVGAGMAGALVASVVALWQREVKRLLAWSSIAQVGYMVLGAGILSVTGMTGALLHLFNHAIMKTALFLALGCVAYRTGGTTLERFAGLGRAMPWTMAGFVAAGLGVAGVPLTAGFISKWYLVAAALEAGWWPLALGILVASLIAVAYLWKVVEVAYFRERPPDAPPVREAPFALLGPLWVLVVATVWFGIDTRLTVGVAETAARELLGR